METNQISNKATRVTAMKWWNSLSLEEKFYKTISWLKEKGHNVTDRHPNTLTGSEIEQIYNKQYKT